jgi:3-oxoacyl-[acyl-carrier-protein] synthase II
VYSNPTPILIRGTGLLTPLGATTNQTWHSILGGQFITDHQRSAGEFNNKSPRVIQMAQQVANQALAEANWRAADNYATVVGTSKGSIESWLTPAAEYMANTPYKAGGPDPTGLADIAAHLATSNGPRLTISAACASGLIALIRAAMMIRSGEATRVLVVAAEASVHPLFLGSFKRLGVLPAPEIGCRPFDQTRDGFLMSEAAAAVCLEADSPANESKPSPQIALEHFALGADATHLTGSDPSGRVLEHLIDEVTPNHPIDLVHAHGTGTLANDEIELATIDRVFSASTSRPFLYSHKGALGHSLGAAGLIGVVLNVLAHQHGTVPPNVQTRHPLPATRVTISQAQVQRQINRSIVLAAGFGGSSAAVSMVTRFP